MCTLHHLRLAFNRNHAAFNYVSVYSCETLYDVSLIVLVALQVGRYSHYTNLGVSFLKIQCHCQTDVTR
jgi:hypothetical protein